MSTQILVIQSDHFRKSAFKPDTLRQANQTAKDQ